VKEDGKEKNNAQPCGNQETCPDRYAVEERVNGQAQKDGRADVVMTNLFGVRFLTEMEMPSEDMLKKMNQEKSGQNVEKRVFAGDSDGFRDDFDKRHGKHIARAERQKILQILAGPLTVDDEISAKQVSARGDQA
jgi:hypothetical protein